MNRAIISCLVLPLAATGVAGAQTVESQQITGTITDPSGAAVPNAEITVVNKATGLSRTVRSNGDGLYVVLNLPVGSYDITVNMPGFKKTVITDVAVDVGAKPAVPIALQIGSSGDSVEVRAETVSIQTNTAEIGGVITSTEATQIQLNGRNYIQLLTLQPGVSQTIASGFGLFGTYGVSGSSQSVNGIRTDSANYFIDGVDNKDNGGGGNNFVNISPDSLQQFRNVASTYDASYGGTSGATVSVAIKSGGRDFHGNAYEYIRNSAIQAYQYIPVGGAIRKPPLRYNDFGYTVGGPVWIPGVFNKNRDKMFFFAAQEFKRLRASTLSTANVPTVGTLNYYLQNSPTTPTGRALASTILSVPGADNAGHNAAGAYTYLNISSNNQSEYLVKIDYQLNEKNQISGHFVHDNTQNVGNPTNFIIYDRVIPGLTSSVDWIHTFSSRAVNTVVGSFSGNKISEGSNIRTNPQFGSPKINRTDFALNYGTLYGASPYIPQIAITGYGNPGVTPRQFDNYQRIYALKDDFSLVLGNHSLKTGAYFWRARKNQTAPPQLNGAFTFPNLAGLVAGNFTQYTEGSAIPQIQARFHQFEIYLQDDWTLSRRLTLNMGLRWQYMPPIASWPNNTSAFDPNYYDPKVAAVINPTSGAIVSAPSPYNGLVLPGNGFSDKAKQVVPSTVYNNPQVQALFHGLPPGLVNTVYNTFSPRAGFAFDVTGQQNTVLRGGFGMSYERVEGNYIYGSASQVPFIANAQLANGSADALTSLGAVSSVQNIGNSFDRNLSPPRIMNYSLGIQQKLSSNTLFEMSYVGSRSGNLTYRKNINQAQAGTQQANPGVNNNALRPYKGFAEIYQYTNGAISNYNSMQARLQTRFKKGGLVSLSWTWSKALTDGSTFDYQPQDSYNIHGDYGPANYNQPKIFVASYVYPLPFWLNSHTWYKEILGGWQVSGITRIANGLPINVIQPSGQSVAGNAVTTASVAQRPNIVANPYLKSGKQYLTYTAFRVPTAGTYGNLQYDGMLGPLYNNWDAALQKNIPIHDTIGVEFRAEMFNVPNHLSPFSIANTLGSVDTSNPGFYQPNFSGTSLQNNFGYVTATTDPRTMEFVLRVNF